VIRYSIRRRDRFVYSTDDNREVIGDENVKGREIEELALELVAREPASGTVAQTALEPYPAERGPRGDVVASVTFLIANYRIESRSCVEYIVECPNRLWCADLVAEIKNQLTRIEAPHRTPVPPWLGTVIGFAAFVLLIVAFYTFLLAPVNISPADEPTFGKLSVSDKLTNVYTFQRLLFSRSSRYEAFYFFTIVLAAISILCHSTKPLTRLSATMQRSYFLWGDQIDVYRRHESRVFQKVRGAAAAVAGVAIAVVAAFIAAPFVDNVRDFVKSIRLP